MALVSGGRSTLNPNAPPFIPAVVRQVEDFSPEWWNLVTTSTWFREYWISQHQEEDIFGEDTNGFVGNDVTQLLPDSIDLGVDEDILNMEAQFEEFLQSSDLEYGSTAIKGVTENGFNMYSEALVKSVSSPKDRFPKSPRDPMYWEKPAKHVSPKCSPRFIHQPR